MPMPIRLQKAQAGVSAVNDKAIEKDVDNVAGHEQRRTAVGVFTRCALLPQRVVYGRALCPNEFHWS